jgi:hypothetical protein
MMDGAGRAFAKLTYFALTCARTWAYMASHVAAFTRPDYFAGALALSAKESKTYGQYEFG